MKFRLEQAAFTATVGDVHRIQINALSQSVWISTHARRIAQSKLGRIHWP
jgi:hypothetical protein